MVDKIESPLLRLPFEIRLMIYECLLYPSKTPSSSASKCCVARDPTKQDSPETNTDPFTLTVRTIDPYLGAHALHSLQTNYRRSKYHVRTGAFLTSSLPTTYHILLSPCTQHLRSTVPRLLSLNRQIHAEAARVLYGTYTFNFSTNVEAIVPFFSDLTPGSRGFVKHVQLTKKAVLNTTEFDRAEWDNVCGFLANEMRIRTLELGVVTRRKRDGERLTSTSMTEGSNEDGDKDNVDDGVKAITKQEFEVLRRMQKEWKASIGGVDLEWVEQLMRIKGLDDVKVRSVAMDHCSGGGGEGMGFWKAFSRSVEGGFEEWVRSVMVGGD